MCISTVNCTYSTWITTQAFKQSLLQGIDIWLTGAHKKWWKWLCGKWNKSLREDWTLPTFTPLHTWTVAVWSVQQCVYTHTSSLGQYWFFLPSSNKVSHQLLTCKSWNVMLVLFDKNWTHHKVFNPLTKVGNTMTEWQKFVLCLSVWCYIVLSVSM